MVESQLEYKVVDGRTYWFAPLSRNVKATPKRVDLVQLYDESIMSYSESRYVLQAALPTDESTREPVPFTHPVLLDGQVIGHWKRDSKRDSVIVETTLYRTLDRAEARALDAAVERYGRFMGVPATPSSAPG